MSEGNEPSSSKRRPILRQGVVSSNAMNKTIAVRVDRLVKHPVYGKYVKRKTVLKAHDPGSECQAGDRVEIEFTRRLSRTKHWRLVRVLARGLAAPAADGGQAAAAPGGES
ncbi:MAG: 30S ribosomal protein S17 [Planctomycetes bacterium]|nr:30S ribosomal protein S17 [Planctomycetota bacterium]